MPSKPTLHPFPRERSTLLIFLKVFISIVDEMHWSCKGPAHLAAADRTAEEWKQRKECLAVKFAQASFGAIKHHPSPSLARSDNEGFKATDSRRRQKLAIAAQDDPVAIYASTIGSFKRLSFLRSRPQTDRPP